MKTVTYGVRSCRWLPLLLLVSLASQGRADDYYVSATLGNDANSGTAPSAPWRTLTHALATVPAPPSGTVHLIHVARGVHDAALGEAFPLVLPPGVRVIGTGSTTVIDGGGAALTLVRVVADSVSQMTPIGPETGLECLVLDHAGAGVGVSSDWIECSPSFRQLRIRNMNVVGLSVATASAWGAGVAAPRLEGSVIESCTVGVRVTEGTEFGDATADLVDCRIRGCTTAGVRVESGGSQAVVQLTRCRVESNTGDGLSAWCTNRGSARAFLVDSVVARNGGHGIDLAGLNAYGGAAAVEVVRSTVVDNGGSGLRTEILYGGWVRLTSSIVVGNADDIETLVGSAPFHVGHDDIGDGDFDGQFGCFSLPPDFADPQSGDYRLRFGSPCVDRGDPADSAPSLDLAHVPRPLDGDLDTSPAVDVGAHELAPLLQTGTAVPGGVIELELLGPAGGSARLLYSRSGLAPEPTSTPFGMLWLPRPELRVLGVFPVSAWPAAQVSLQVPNVPGLGGTVVAYQAVITSPAAPSGRALSNAVAVEIQELH